MSSNKNSDSNYEKANRNDDIAGRSQQQSDVTPLTSTSTKQNNKMKPISFVEHLDDITSVDETNVAEPKSANNKITHNPNILEGTEAVLKPVATMLARFVTGVKASFQKITSKAAAQPGAVSEMWRMYREIETIIINIYANQRVQTHE